MHYFLPASIVLCGVLSSAVQAADDKADQVDQRSPSEAAIATVDRAVRKRMEEFRLPAVVYGIVHGDDLVHVGIHGFRDLESEAPPTRSTLFRIASMSKSFTALAVLLLRDEGKFSLDDAVSQYVPELRSLELPTDDSGAITIRQLMTHQAGFPDDNAWADRQLDISERTLSEWLAAGPPFSSVPGTGYEYANYGYAILGRLVANVSGRPFTAFVRERILAPLNLDATYYDVVDLPAERLAAGYSIGRGHLYFAPAESDAPHVPEPALGDGAFAAIGGLYTDAKDMGRWISFMLSPFTSQGHYADIARPGSIREMQVGSGFPDLSVNVAAPGAPVQASAGVYGFGLRISQTCQFERVVGHSGGLPGFGSNMQWLPDYGVGVFVLTNLTYAPAHTISADILDVLSRTGAIARQPRTPSDDLRKMAGTVFELIDDWDDDLIDDMAASNLYLDRPRDLRQSDIETIRNGLGKCELAHLRPANRLSADLEIACDRGRIGASIVLAPTSPPLLQVLQVSGGKFPGEIVSESTDVVIAGINTGKIPAGFNSAMDPGSLATMLAGVRESYGSCREGKLVGGDGVNNVRLELDCDFGEVEMAVTLEENAIGDLQFRPGTGARCNAW